MMEPEQRFKIEQVLTYKRNEDCPNGRYKYGGITPKRLKQKLVRYVEFNSQRNCWAITVTHDNGGHYNMLEDEFEEYNQVDQKEKSNYSIF